MDRSYVVLALLYVALAAVGAFLPIPRLIPAGVLALAAGTLVAGLWQARRTGGT